MQRMLANKMYESLLFMCRRSFAIMNKGWNMSMNV